MDINDSYAKREIKLPFFVHRANPVKESPGSLDAIKALFPGNSDETEHRSMMSIYHIKHMTVPRRESKSLVEDLG